MTESSMDYEYAAGHTFYLGRCACGTLMSDIIDITEDFIDKDGIAHNGKLTKREYSEIEALRNKKRRAVCVVMGW